MSKRPKRSSRQPGPRLTAAEQIQKESIDLVLSVLGTVWINSDIGMDIARLVMTCSSRALVAMDTEENGGGGLTIEEFSEREKREGPRAELQIVYGGESDE